MVALYNKRTKSVVENYGNSVPSRVVAGGLDVWNPQPDWDGGGDYKFIPVFYQGQAFDEFQVITETRENLNISANGYVELVISNMYTDLPLDDIKAQLCNRLDARASDIRTRYVGTDASQIGIYIMKYLEAVDIKGKQNPNPNNYPIHKLLANTVLANTIIDAADSTIAQFNAWITIGANVDKIRLVGKANIMAANTVNEVLTAFNAVSWVQFGDTDNHPLRRGVNFRNVL